MSAPSSTASNKAGSWHSSAAAIASSRSTVQPTDVRRFAGGSQPKRLLRQALGDTKPSHVSPDCCSCPHRQRAASCDTTEAEHALKKAAEDEVQINTRWLNGKYPELQAHLINISGLNAISATSCEALVSLSIPALDPSSKTIRFEFLDGTISWHDMSNDISLLVADVEKRLEIKKNDEILTADANEIRENIRSLNTSQSCPAWMTTPSFNAVAAGAFKYIDWKYAGGANIWEAARIGVADQIEDDHTQNIELPDTRPSALGDFFTIRRLRRRRSVMQRCPIPRGGHSMFAFVVRFDGIVGSIPERWLGSAPALKIAGLRKLSAVQGWT